MVEDSLQHSEASGQSYIPRYNFHMHQFTRPFRLEMIFVAVTTLLKDDNALKYREASIGSTDNNNSCYKSLNNEQSHKDKHDKRQ